MPDTSHVHPDVLSLRKVLLLKKQELSALLEITQAINQDTSEETLYKIFQFTLLGQLNIRRIVLYVKEEGRWQCTVSFGFQLADFRKIELPNEIIDSCVAGACSISSLKLDAEWQKLETVIPVTQQDAVLAYVMIGNVQEDYTDEEAIKFLETLSNILIGAIENRRLNRQRISAAAMRKEIEIAQEVQNLLFPSKLPNDAQVAVHASYVPHTAIGGDYYDVVSIDKDRFLFCVADVSGKGVPASLLMSNFQAGLRTLLRQNVDLATIVHELNHLLFRNSGGEKFITVFFGIYNRATRHLQYVNAGHNDPILLPDVGPVQYLKTGTVMLGIMEKLPMLTVGETEIPPHSLLLSYTDGLTEVFDESGAEYGEEGLIKLIQRNRYLPLTALHKEMLREIEEFSTTKSHFADDVTILSCRFK
ncbi:PP2C family protein-serine/threonine phosphatase [Hymenobacter cellulosilyticus]|uniref:Serine/threonine-protein phosphatase n=1 Tax=Hymenobacter cellulosilyticus TaxID=2932248 RepID=A0A8T9Q157_9BACT|nr:PP2C family protein-serine/threonine phosphatase [Hymenobacter cellulosilyticus]UOQ70151.1 serine/threonine-protein phosphatase [Hymenobacter cellulosilyticus]